MPQTARVEDAVAYADRAAALIEDYARAGQFSGAVLVAQDGKVLLRKGFGLADREWDIPNGPDTVFRVGSVTKQFTAAAILQLVEQGRLGLDDPIASHYAGAPATWSKVTIRHLLAHSSGIPSYTADAALFRRQMTIDRTPEEIIALTRDAPLDFEPGARFEYDNSGYVILGHLIETVSGQSYRDYLQAHIFAPLGMGDTSYDDGVNLVPRRAAGYRIEGKQWRNARYLSMTQVFAAGGLCSTVDDLLRWDRALYTDAVLDPRSREQMFMSQGHDYGLGWQLRDQHGHRLQVHGGSIEGFRAILCRYPDDRLVVIVLSNLEISPVDWLASNLAAIHFGLDTPRTTVALEPELLDHYVGHYRLGPGFVVAIRREDARFFAEATGQPRIELFAQSEREFVLNFVDARIVFAVDADGIASSLTYTRNGIDLTGRRVSEAEAAQAATPVEREHKEVAIDPGLLDHYVGRYQLAPNFVLTVTREGDGLFTQATGQQQFRVFPESEIDFFAKQFPASLTFETDGAGRATRLILHQGGLDMPAPRID